MTGVPGGQSSRDEAARCHEVVRACPGGELLDDLGGGGAGRGAGLRDSDLGRPMRGIVRGRLATATVAAASSAMRACLRLIMRPLISQRPSG
jgi:hypothetical protein